MHNIKEIRQNLEHYKDKLKSRNIDVNYDDLVSLDEKNRSLIQKKELLEKEKKEISKKKDKSLFERSKEITIEIEKLSENQKNVSLKLDNTLSKIPNIPLDDVPIGKDETSNKEISNKLGTIPTFLKAKPIQLITFQTYIKDTSRSLNGRYTITSTQEMDKDRIGMNRREKR